jgi:hypothetical protein
MAEPTQETGLALVVLLDRYLLHRPAFPFEEQIVYQIGCRKTATSDCPPDLVAPVEYLATAKEPANYFTDRTVWASIEMC